jgi:hypothetical protein
MNNTNTKSTSGSEGNEAREQHKGDRVLKLGLDLHYRQVTVAMQEDGGRIKGAGKMSHQAFGHWMDKKLAAGWQIESCYEAGASGYWLNRQLAALGVKNLVVASKAMGQGGKRQKTDRRDSAELVDCLDRNLRGQDKALSVVAVPSVEGEEKRALIRYHRQMMGCVFKSDTSRTGRSMAAHARKATGETRNRAIAPDGTAMSFRTVPGTSSWATLIGFPP